MKLDKVFYLLKDLKKECENRDEIVNSSYSAIQRLLGMSKILKECEDLLRFLCVDVKWTDEAMSTKYKIHNVMCKAKNAQASDHWTYALERWTTGQPIPKEGASDG